MRWQEEYKRKFVSPDEAVKIIKSGDTVVIPIDTQPQALSKALINKNEELEDVTIMIRQPRHDIGWFQDDLGRTFNIILDTQAGIGAQAVAKGKLDFIPHLTSLRFRDEHDPRRIINEIDVVMIVVSPPDTDGFCSFGLYLSHKKDYAMRAKKVLAEVSDTPEMCVRVPGDNYIHVSQIDFFVEHIPLSPMKPQLPQPTSADVSIAGYISSIVRDGDTLQIGPGSATSLLPQIGAFDNKNDLGIHSAIIRPQLLQLVRRGIVNGKSKNINFGRAVSGGFIGALSEEDLAFIDRNAAFDIRNMSYVNDIQVIASHDRMVAINGVLAIDLAGQIAADSIGRRMWAGAGGQVDFVIGAMLSKGGASIAVLRSTTSGGKSSRIVPTFEEGTAVTLPRTFADYVITEYGIAELWGKSQKQRAQELISIAHPDSQAELKRQAEKLL